MDNMTNFHSRRSLRHCLVSYLKFVVRDLVVRLPYGAHLFFLAIFALDCGQLASWSVVSGGM
jgi:hypothetical protein